jgi:iron-sulfur cluster assembly accessory protein
MQYGMAFEETAREFDKVVAVDGVRLIVDPTSLMYLQGATIDYVDSLMGGGFRIENPNAVSSCGCGHSFRTSNDSGESTEGCGSCSH